jgi:hypothetical protein
VTETVRRFAISENISLTVTNWKARPVRPANTRTSLA